MNSKAKLAIICAVLIFVAGVLWLATSRQRSLPTLTYSQFLDQVQSGHVDGVTVIDRNRGAEAICRMKNGSTVRTVLPSNYRDALAAMQEKMVKIEITSSRSVLASSTPFLLLLAVWVVLMIWKFPNGPRRRVLG